MTVARALVLLLTVGAGTASSQTERLELQLFSEPMLVAADFLSPAIPVEVNGASGWMLVDTGAAVHTWSRWFADEARIPRAASPQARLTDSTASTLAAGWAAPITVRSGNAQFALGVAAVADFAAEFRAVRIAGALSPQLLAGRGQAVVLDLQQRRLSVAPEATAFLGEPALAAGRDAFTCPQQSGGLRALSYGVVAQAQSRSLRLLLDTGANHTKLAAPAVPELASGPDESGTTTGVSGRREAVWLASADVAFGGRTRRVEARVSASRESGCGPDGLLGIDVLSGCVLVLGHTRLSARCGP